MTMIAIELLEKSRPPIMSIIPKNTGMKRSQTDTEKKTRREEETPVQNLGLDLEIYLEIGLDLEIYLETTKETGDTGTTALGAEEILALCLELEIYLVIDIGTEVGENPALCPDLEIYLGKGKGIVDTENPALTQEDIVG